MAESSTALSLGGAPQYLSTNGFAEHVGMYSGANQGSSSVHNLKGNHKIHHFRTGVAPVDNQTFPSGDTVTGSSADPSGKSKAYGSRANTNALTGGLVGQGPAFSITGDQLLRPSVPANDPHNWQSTQPSESLRPQPDSFLQGQRLSPLVGSNDFDQHQTPMRALDGEASTQFEGSRSLLSQRPKPAGPPQESPAAAEAAAAKQPKTYDYLFV